MIKAVIFDLDGLLIDSEPLWRIADIEVFGKRGITLTEDDCKTTTGMRVDEVVKYWSLKYPEANLNLKETEDSVVQALERLIDEKGEPLSGVNKILSFFKSIDLPMAIASASALSIINRVVKKFNIEDKFTVIQSAEKLNYGKPHPEVFIKAAEQLNANPWECLVFEDSVYGVIAGKAARMKVVAVPDIENFNNEEYCIADKKIKLLDEFDMKMWKEFNL